MATGSPTEIRRCQAPRPNGSPCGRPLEGARTYCDEHARADRQRTCEATLGANGSARRCQAWPEANLPYCPQHDPLARELRRQEAQSARARIKQVEKLVDNAPLYARARCLALLVAEGVVSPQAVERVLRAYAVLG
jgi:hypothetical protein